MVIPLLTKKKVLFWKLLRGPQFSKDYHTPKDSYNLPLGGNKRDWDKKRARSHDLALTTLNGDMQNKQQIRTLHLLVKSSDLYRLVRVGRFELAASWSQNLMTKNQYKLMRIPAQFTGNPVKSELDMNENDLYFFWFWSNMWSKVLGPHVRMPARMGVMSPEGS